jgi:hypothetical protein
VDFFFPEEPFHSHQATSCLPYVLRDHRADFFFPEEAIHSPQTTSCFPYVLFRISALIWQ